MDFSFTEEAEAVHQLAEQVFSGSMSVERLTWKRIASGSLITQFCGFIVLLASQGCCGLSIFCLIVLWWEKKNRHLRSGDT